MNVHNELYKLYKKNWQEVRNLHDGGQIELLNMEKRKEKVKKESELLLERCVFWQNEIITALSVPVCPPIILDAKAKNKKRKEPTTAGIATGFPNKILSYSTALRPLPSSVSVTNLLSPADDPPIAPVLRDLSPAKAPSPEEGGFREDDDSEENQSGNQEDKTPFWMTLELGN